jgi:[ribosomal protein S5]-alanine N-acetyltransferase
VTEPWDPHLTEGKVGLERLTRRHADAWRESRLASADWLAPWDATVPPGANGAPPSFAAMVRRLNRETRELRMLPLAITYEGRFVGQLTVGGIIWGSQRGCHFGYWVDRRAAGRGIMPTAVAMATDHAFGPLGLHRVEINIRPENTASRRVVEKLGFREEGIRRRYLHIAGQWTDHMCFAMTAEEVPQGLLARWRSARDYQS